MEDIEREYRIRLNKKNDYKPEGKKEGKKEGKSKKSDNFFIVED